ncbi:MAG: CDP-alcohol phosphatidyltransferase family protein [Syntrophobacteria bacterium]
MSWETKPTDRFLLRCIKTRICAPLSTGLVRVLPEFRPDVLTCGAACLGISGGVAFGLGLAWLGGLLAAAAQVLDGMDGQVARLTGRQSPRGAFLDSVLDRYMDFSLIFGMLLHCLRFSAGMKLGGLVVGFPWLVLIAALAAAGASQVSYATARAASLHLNYRRPEFAGKGTRTAVIILCGLLAPLWIHAPLIGLLYLALHPNLAVVVSLAGLKGGDE